MAEENLIDIVDDSIEALELPGVLEEISKYAFSEPGRAEIMSSEPWGGIDEILYHLNLVTQFKEMTSIKGPLGISGLVPMEGISSKLDNSASILDSEEILVILDFLTVCDAVKFGLDHVDERYNLVREQTRRLVYLSELRNKISKIFDEHGAVRSDASPALIRIHHRIRAVREGIRHRLERIVQDRDLSRIVQEDYITMRNDRYVILLRPEFKGLLEGIIHDHSRSGASVYVEPFSVVELNNQVASLADEEREEIRKIFEQVTGHIRAVKEEMAQNYNGLVWLDAYQARALWAIATNSIAPQLSEEGFRIIGGRHPLLPVEESEVVPMDVVQDSSNVATIISGANMGGKTVALKLTGLFALMTRCGILLPAREGTQVQPFTRIMADIGDEQDIRGKVSTFSGHIIRIKAIVENSSKGDLVLLDELGGATDPEEGSAIAMAILDNLISRGVRVVATTHLTQLKAYALSRPAVKNVSVEFHPVTLKPTFRLLYDLPGESHAIVTAERIGLPAGVIAAARSYLDKSAGGSSQLIQNLKEKLADVDRTQSELWEKRAALDVEMEKVKAERENVLEEFRKEAREMLNRARRELADLQNALKRSKETKIVPKPSETLEQIKRDFVAKLGALERSIKLPQVGSKVLVKKFDKQGTVTEVTDKGRLGVSIGGINLVADLDDVVLLNIGQEKKSPSKIGRIGVDISPSSPRWEVNVIGMRVDEALPVVEKAIDQALLGGLPSLNIIHGKGTGRLKKAIREYLSGNKLVRSFQSGEAGIGGEGVTVVEMVME